MEQNLVDSNSLFIKSFQEGCDFERKNFPSQFPKENLASKLLGDKDLLVKLVNQCFWASIQLEEGRTVKGTVCICSQDEAPLSRAFKKPLTLSIKNLVALMTACPGSILAVQASGDGVEIWGVLDTGAPMFAVKLRIAGAGVLITSTQKRVLAVLEKGEVRVSAPSMGEDWFTLVAKALDQTKSFEERLTCARLLQGIVIAIHKMGHGGALVVGPSQSTEWTEDVQINFEFDAIGSKAISRRISELKAANQQYEDNLSKSLSGQAAPFLHAETFVAANGNLLESLLNRIGEHGAIDGAVVVNEDLKLYGFGAKLKAKVHDFKVIEICALTGQSKDISCSGLGGTRHQSAAVRSDHIGDKTF